MPHSPTSSLTGAGWTALVAAAAIAAPGCLPFRPAPDAKVAAAPQLQLPRVETGRVCLELMDSQKPAVGREEFIDKIGTLLTNHQQASAAQAVRRFPDVAWDVVRSANNADAANPTVRFIARVHDEQCCVQGTSATWSSMLESRHARPDDYKSFDKACAGLREAAANPRLNERLTTVGELRAPHLMLEIEATRLAGEALLQQNRPAEAAKLLARAFDQAKTADSLVAAQVALSLGEAQRR
ncbi:MAG TPA: hypothetical protein VE988_24060, partial [Gemmataceae bacterium]|nr:hypothetical protein [Gemmataceae bacterium]